jgi:hypothetical protein
MIGNCTNECGASRADPVPSGARRVLASARQDRMTSDWERLMCSLGDVERERLRRAFDADPELADGVSGVLADLPLDTRQQVLRRLAARLTQAPLGGGALIAALTDVVYDAMKRSEHEDR